MNLDNLHKVMKGDMTIDQACEGMTDDYEIGHVSHRADGDYKKVAQGKWVPVKAGGGQEQMGAKAQSTEKQARSLHSLNQQMGLGGKATGEEAESIREELTERDRQAPAAKTEDILKTSTAQTIKRSRNGVTDDDVVRFFNEEIKGRGNGTDAHALRIFGNTSQMMTQFDQWYKREKSRKAEQQGKDQNKNVLTSADDVNWDIIEQVQKEAYKANKTHTAPEMMEKYDITQIQKFANANVDTGFANGDGIKGYLKKKAGLPGGVDLNVASKELAKFNNWQNARDIWRRYENKELDVDDTGHFYVSESARPKADGEERLTRDTKISLSRIKREQTQDKKYNVGEISQKTGLQKQQDGSWAPPKQGRGAAYQEADKKVEALRDRGFNRTQLKNLRMSELDKLYESEIGGSAGGEKKSTPAGGNKPEPIALNEREQGEANRVMENLKNFDEKYTDRTKVRMKPGKNNHWDVFYGGKKIATMIGSVMQRDTAKKMGWFGEKG